MNWSNILARAGWTLIQAFAGSVTAVSVAPIDLTGLKAVAIAAGAAAIAAGISFVKSFFIERLTS